MSEWLIRGCGALALLVVAAIAFDARAEPEAIAYGRGGCGKLSGGEALPCDGENFEAFSSLACLLGRNYAHPLVAKTMTDAYALLEREHAKRTWQYGELGWEDGGRLRPHRTHQNGLSADFFVPVSTADGSPSEVPVSIFNKLGYAHDFTRKGKLDDLEIDWRALGDHLTALATAGKPHGVGIEKVIITPPYHPHLFRAAPQLRAMSGAFMKKEAWVRHDEHYHVDFTVPARYRRPLKCD